MGLDGTIDTIYESDNMNLIYYWVTNCLSNSTGKRKWNKFCSDRRMKDFITFSDEAFAMLALENNAEKWRDSVKFPTLKKKDLPKALSPYWYRGRIGPHRAYMHVTIKSG